MSKIQIERTKKSPAIVHAKKSSPIGRISMRLGKPDRILRWAAELTPMGMIEESKHGIRGRQLEQIQEASNFSNEEWARFLQIAPRTIQRYRKQNAVMDSTSTERALLMAQIVERGREVFGSEVKFKMWLAAPSFALGDIAPKELLDTTTGMHVVKAELTRIEHGVY